MWSQMLLIMVDRKTQGRGGAAQWRSPPDDTSLFWFHLRLMRRVKWIHSSLPPLFDSPSAPDGSIWIYPPLCHVFSTSGQAVAVMSGRSARGRTAGPQADINSISHLQERWAELVTFLCYFCLGKRNHISSLHRTLYPTLLQFQRSDCLVLESLWRV